MSVELLQTLSLVSYILAGLLFLLAVGLFFYLKVPALWGEVTGRTARKAIQAMKWKNEESAPKSLPVLSRGVTDSGLSAKLAEAAQLREEESASPSHERIPLVATEQKPPLKVAPTADAPEKTPDPQSAEDPIASPSAEGSDPTAETAISRTDILPTPEVGLTEVLSVEGAGLTDILPASEEGLTAVLSSSKVGETDLLPRPHIGETAVLSTTAYNDFLLRSTGELPRADETTLLRQEQGAVQVASSGVFFEIEKELAFTDSTEIIE